jgi:hypothetical protein
MECPKCGAKNNDNWPIRVDGKILDGGCQECWELECAESWWQMVNTFNAVNQHIGS